MLTALRRAAPKARIITVGYPHLVPEDTTKCIPGSLFGFGAITRDDLAWLRVTALEPLNAMIRARTAQQSGQYVDVYTSSKGHSVPTSSGATTGSRASSTPPAATPWSTRTPRATPTSPPWSRGPSWAC